MATDDFDPYEQWLGISRHQRPIDFYRLLGLERFESDPLRIIAAADERMAYIRQFQTGPRGLHTQRLLNEFSAAKLKLLNPTTKAEYDERLRHSAQAAEEFAMADDVALPEAILPSDDEWPTSPTAVQPRVVSAPADQPRIKNTAAPAVPVQIQARHRRPAFEKPSRAARFAGVALGILAVAAIVVAIGRWYQDRQQQIAKLQSEDQLVGMGKTRPRSVPEGFVDQQASGQVRLDARHATIHGSTATLVNDGKSDFIANWTAGDDYVSWNFLLRKGYVFRIQVTYAADNAPEGARWQVRCDGQEKSWDVRPSGGPEQFVTDDQTLMQIQEPGEYQLELRILDKPDNSILSVQSVTLEPRRR